jgi:HK97 family phage major capsid protein
MADDTLTKVREITTAYARNTVAINTNFDRLTDRIEALEAGADRPRAAGGMRYSHEDNEHKSVFLEWLRKPTDPRREGRLSEAQHEMQRKDVSIGSNIAGGYGLPKEINNSIELRVRQLNPFRSLVDVVSCGSNDFHSLVSLGDGTSGWVAETATRTATATPNLRDIQPTMGEQYSLMTASNWSLQDLFFNVEQWLVNDASADFAAAEATAIISGNGTARPTGILNTSPVTTADTASPMRAAAAIQYIPITSPGSPVALTFDSFIDLVAAVQERYLQEADRCAFAMSRTTLARLRKLKAVTAGAYLWEPDAQSAAPPMLLGYKVVTTDAMPAIALNSYSVIFGNWRRGYLLADRVGMSIIVNPYSVPGVTSFYLSRRLGGKIKNNHCLKALKTKES